MISDVIRNRTSQRVFGGEKTVVLFVVLSCIYPEKAFSSTSLAGDVE